MLNIYASITANTVSNDKDHKETDENEAILPNGLLKWACLFKNKQLEYTANTLMI